MSSIGHACVLALAVMLPTCSLDILRPFPRLRCDPTPAGDPEVTGFAVLDGRAPGLTDPGLLCAWALSEEGFAYEGGVYDDCALFFGLPPGNYELASVTRYWTTWSHYGERMQSNRSADTYPPGQYWGGDVVFEVRAGEGTYIGRFIVGGFEAGHYGRFVADPGPYRERDMWSALIGRFEGESDAWVDVFRRTRDRLDPARS